MEKDNIFIGDLPADIDENVVRTAMETVGTIVKMRVNYPTVPGGKSSALVQFGSANEAKWAVDTLNGTTPPGFVSPAKICFAESPEEKMVRQYGKGEAKTGGAARMSPYPAGQAVNPWASGGTAVNPGLATPGGAPDWFAAGPPVAVQSSPKGGGKAKGKKSLSKGLGAGVSIHHCLGRMEEQGLIPNPKSAAPDCVVYVKNLPSDCTDLEIYKMFAPFGAISSARAIWQDDGTCKGYGFVNFVEPVGAQSAIAMLNGFQMTNGQILGVEIKKASSMPAITGGASWGGMGSAGGLGNAGGPGGGLGALGNAAALGNAGSLSGGLGGLGNAAALGNAGSLGGALGALGNAGGLTNAGGLGGSLGALGNVGGLGGISGIGGLGATAIGGMTAPSAPGLAGFAGAADATATTASLNAAPAPDPNAAFMASLGDVLKLATSPDASGTSAHEFEQQMKLLQMQLGGTG